MNSPPEVKKADAAEREKSNRRENLKIGIDGLTLLIVFIYAALTAWLAISSQQSVTIAKDANSNALQSGRPWMGAQFEVSDFTLGSTPVYTMSYVNTGGRPAIVTAAFNHVGMYQDFPSDPDKEYGPNSAGTRFIVPGQPYIMGNPGVHPLTPSQVNEINNGPRTLWAFGKVEYTDPRTGEQYWTHICLRYLPAFSNSGNSGFRSCHQYNDAK